MQPQKIPIDVCNTPVWLEIKHVSHPLSSVTSEKFSTNNITEFIVITGGKLFHWRFRIIGRNK
ncbi:hypothetical protein BLA29_013508 [Euroglyphus maynei]|uniref:Uncharacterized protein n=1 Tax=Euroglyphus maynei TaxID=6958 RepID=A0A1Y3BUV6_EURMA|nr:hypothetical protein BLA29_013508 [Euroglyphus maynei]